MPRQPTPPEAPPLLEEMGVLGVILLCQNRECRHRAWLDPPALKGLTALDLHQRGKCTACGARGCSAEIISASPTGMKAAQSDDVRAAKLKQWIEDHPRG